MSEEEIIKVITYKLNMKNADVYAPILYEEIQNLLDLYNKEKEKTPESIRKQFEIYQNRICELEDKIKELETENFNIKQQKIIDKNSIPQQENFYDYYNYIHKDKIKEKIKMVATVLYEQHELDYEDIIDVITEVISHLKKELLEE